jgi:hypothetical protein
MKIIEITDKATIKIKGLVNAFHHNHDIDFEETQPNVFMLDREYYRIKIYGSTSVKVSIHCIGDKRDKLFTAKQPLQCVKEVLSETEKIDKNVELLLEFFNRVERLKDNQNIKIKVDKQKGIFILGTKNIKMRLSLWFTGLLQFDMTEARLICEFPGVFWPRDTEQVSFKTLDAFILAVQETCNRGDGEYASIRGYDNFIGDPPEYGN